MKLGYEVGTGAEVNIPMHHMVVTGQTQNSGKTTTLEALISRAGVSALAFVTKRGEGSFADAKTIRPFFKEEANWQFVASILEASRGEKLKFERAWIIRASKGARTLADVQRNVRKAMETAKGMSADVYLTLDAYLDAVVPQIDRIRWADTVDVSKGMSVMDLTMLNIEMQHLVIRSTIDWVLNHATDTVVVVPEAWKFIPQGRGTPVKLAAEAYIRQAAGLRNYLWLDSQDIAGVDKLILKSVPVWILGVQRESNEIKRTLDQIPAGTRKPKPADIATLSLGHFIACYGTHTIKTYVQPIWMESKLARDVAMGNTDFVPPKPRTIQPKEEPTVRESEAQALRDENEELRRKIRRMERLAEEAAEAAERPSPVQTRPPQPKAAPAPRVDSPIGFDEANYQEIKRRLTAEAPGILRVITIKPELSIEVKRQTVTADSSTWLGGVAQLVAEGFFDDPMTSSAAHQALKRRGLSGIPARAYEALEKLNGMGFVTSEGKGVGYKAVKGMKINIVET